MRALRWIGLILALLVLIAAALVGGFLLGKQSVPTPTPTVTVTPTPTPTRHADGVYSWQEIAPGDCLSDFVSAWQDQYTVVACDQKHTGQMLARVRFADASVAYPGSAALAKEVKKLCASKDLYSPEAANEYPSIYFPGAYPMSAEEWASAPTYECFATPGTGHVLTTDLMPGAVNHTPSATPTPALTPTPTPAA